MKPQRDLISWVALVVSIAAATFTALQWIEAREARRLQFDATLIFDIDTELTQHRAGIAIRNLGPGVARIRSITYYLDGKVFDNPDTLLDQVKLDSNRDQGIDLDPGDSIGAGETNWLVRYPFRGGGEEQEVIDLFEHRLEIGIDYCAANGKCAAVCTNLGHCSGTASSSLIVSADTRSHTRENTEAAHSMMLAETLNLVITGVVAIATLFLYFATRDLVRGGEDTAKKDLRAYVAPILDNMRTGMLSADVPVWSAVFLKNLGRTPAHQVRHAVNYRVLPVPLPPDLEVEHPLTEADQFPFVLHPGEARESTTNDKAPLSDADLKLLQTDQFALYMIGKVTYSDIYHVERRSTYCVYVPGREIVDHRKLFVEGKISMVPGKWKYATRFNEAS